ncbi:MAG: hypothetical protein AAGD25_05540 [Cyanobacteria bacterium P01_F01_bin.150]
MSQQLVSNSPFLQFNGIQNQHESQVSRPEVKDAIATQSTY